ncbi:MAG TPA: YraN family protein [Acidiphilium sp.]|nr:MAG: YraN family protein [Acidiphilium sp. 21-60-14]OYV92114.1 MAG: YraN family protein [Acidiphilium sp. 37-60-79]OZB38967.1 MAG: YraN family protein [Acidiphilium sp. 34-60-192]HQT88462.1 YraN family protein [Acidiphilium sp.]HQU23287.1 YraN family protein [Acidiphilium sp.]
MKTNKIDDRGLLRRQTRQQAETKGRRSEALAAQWLSDLGYQILGQRLRTASGEIDLVVQNETVLAFVEVKARASEAAGLYAISPRQRQRLVAAATILLAAHPEWQRPDIRFDVIVLAGEALSHWPAAFRADDAV